MSRQLLLEIIPAQGPTLAATVPGSNAAAVAAVAGLERGRALYLWGPPGSGRSHLLRATAGARPIPHTCLRHGTRSLCNASFDPP